MFKRRFSVIAFMFLFCLPLLSMRDFSPLEQSAAADRGAKAAATDIADQQVAIAKEALQLIKKRDEQSQSSASSPEQRGWYRRLVDAMRKNRAPKAEILAVIQEFLAHMDQRVAHLKKLHETQAVTQLDVLDAQYEALDARAWLEEEQQK